MGVQSAVKAASGVPKDTKPPAPPATEAQQLQKDDAKIKKQENDVEKEKVEVQLMKPGPAKEESAKVVKAKEDLLKQKKKIVKAKAETIQEKKNAKKAELASAGAAKKAEKDESDARKRLENAADNAAAKEDAKAEAE